MSIKEMWNYLIFQMKGYRQLGAAIVAGAVCGAGVSYINSIPLNHLHSLISTHLFNYV